MERREELFAAIRLSRRVGRHELTADGGGIVSFPTAVVGNDGVDDLTVDAAPGVWVAGQHVVHGWVLSHGIRIDGTFTVVVDDGRAEAMPAEWTATDPVSGAPRPLPDEVERQLPRSFTVACHTGGTLSGAVRRVHLAAERARQELIESNNGLTMTVVNRFRALVRAESASLDMSDLVIVGKHQLLDVVDRHFTDPDRRPTRDVAWSKLVQRAIGNAVRASSSSQV